MDHKASISQDCLLNLNNLVQQCTINNTNRTEIQKQIMFLQQKYDKIKRKLQGKKVLNSITEQDIQEISNIMNVIAMKHSQQGKNKIAEQWLKRVLKYAQFSPRARIITFNNLACIYKQSNQLQLALMYINKAQKQADLYCLQNEDSKILKVLTDCSLNLCAILSALGEHYKALKAARKAIKTIKSAQNIPNSYFLSLYPIAKYNQAVELQTLKMYQEANFAYLQVKKFPSLPPNLFQRVNIAILQLKQKTQKIKQSSSSFNKTFRSIKLSLPKFNFKQSYKQQVNFATIVKPPTRKKAQSLQKYNNENKIAVQFRNLQDKDAKQSEYSSIKTTKTTRSNCKNILQLIQN